jgi:hypothetical protein
MESTRHVPVRQLILVPAVITLAVTILRLLGELLDWSPVHFSREAGGGGSLVGIAWLVPIFGIWFGVKLARMGEAPASSWRAVGAAAGGLAIAIGSVVVATQLGLSPMAMLVLMAATSLLAAWVATLGWPALGRTLVAYGVAARVPVVLVMLAAIIGSWGTHYDVSGPEFAVVDTWNPLLKWLVIGVVPQLTVWIALTIIFGVLFGVPAAALARRRVARPIDEEPNPAHA